MNESTSSVQHIIDFINTNDGINAWLIILVTAVVIPVIGFILKRVFFKKKEAFIIQEQKSGDGSEMYQSIGDMSITKNAKDE